MGKRTNPLGAKAVADAFSDHTVSLLDISNSELDHLKDGFAMAGREIMAVAPGTDCAVILKVLTMIVTIYDRISLLLIFCT